MTDSLRELIANTDITYLYRNPDGTLPTFPSAEELKAAREERERKYPYIVPGCDQCIHEDRCPRPYPFTNNPQRAEEAYPDDEILQYMTKCQDGSHQSSGLFVCKECVRRCFPKHGWGGHDD